MEFSKRLGLAIILPVFVGVGCFWVFMGFELFTRGDTLDVSRAPIKFGGSALVFAVTFVVVILSKVPPRRGWVAYVLMSILIGLSLAVFFYAKFYVDGAMKDIVQIGSIIFGTVVALFWLFFFYEVTCSSE